jgi:Tfp pilus assembly protein PilO
VRKLSTREKLLIGSLALMVVLYAGLEFWYLPLTDQVQALKAEKAELETEWERVRYYAEEKAAIRQDIARLNTEIAALMERVLPPNQSYRFWEAVLEKTASTQVTATLLSEQDSEEKMSLQFSVRGPGQNVYQFMRELEQIPYIHAVIQGDIRIEEQEAVASFTVLIHQL